MHRGMADTPRIDSPFFSSGLRRALPIAPQQSPVRRRTIKNNNSNPSFSVVSFFLAAISVHSILFAQSQTEHSGLRSFQPGVFIDWANRAVEVAARVALREGPLELFACSPQTKEHESVLVVQARPLHIFQAMGLIGLEAGSPPHYDEKLDRWFPASGEPLDLRVRWQDGDRQRTISPAAWMVEKKTGKIPEALRWVFAGSIVVDQGGFAADQDGTVACVVDFDSALIALSTRHSADDAELWLHAHPENIPPRGTHCTLLIRSAYHPKLEVQIKSKNQFRLGQETLSGEQVAERLTKGRDERTPFLVVMHQGVHDADVKEAVTALESQLRRRNVDPNDSMKVRAVSESIEKPAEKPEQN